MKIAFLLPSLANVGPIIVAYTIIKHIIESPDIPLTEDNITVFYFDKKYGLDFPVETLEVTPQTSSLLSKFDIIHSHGFRPDKYIYKHREELKKTKYISTIHQDIYVDFKYTYNIIIAKLFLPVWLKYFKVFDAVVPISKKIAKLYQSTLLNLGETIYNGVDVDTDFLPISDETLEIINQLRSKGKTIIGTYANLTKRKGIDLLVRLVSKRKEIVLVIIGNGKEEKHLQRMVIQNHIEDRVLFLPSLKKPYKYLRDTDIYAMPSRSEGFGLALAEMALNQVPIVCSDIDVFKEIYNNEEVEFFSKDDIDSLSSAIDNALKRKDSLIRNAYKKTQNNYTGEIMAKRYYRLYSKLLLSSK